MKKALLTTLTLSVFTLLYAADTSAGAKLVDDTCTACHLTSSSSAKLTDGKMGGPPMWGVMKKIRNKYPEREDRITFLIDYALHPSEEKMLFPAATREYFGVMPSMQEKVTDEEMRQIAEYLADYHGFK